MSQMEGNHLAGRVPPPLGSACRPTAGTVQSSTGWPAPQWIDARKCVTACGIVLVLPACELGCELVIHALVLSVVCHNDMQVGCVVWCGVVWCGVVWCGVVWCGVQVI